MIPVQFPDHGPKTITFADLTVSASDGFIADELMREAASQLFSTGNLVSGMLFRPFDLGEVRAIKATYQLGKFHEKLHLVIERGSPEVDPYDSFPREAKFEFPLKEVIDRPYPYDVEQFMTLGMGMIWEMVIAMSSEFRRITANRRVNVTFDPKGWVNSLL